MANDVRSVRWGKGELDLFLAAAKEARLPFNRWVRRACREAAALEKAVETEKKDRPLVNGVAHEFPERLVAREFKPDFRPVKKR